MLQWWNKLKRYFYNRSLNEKTSIANTQRTVINLADAKSIGILYDSTTPDNDIIITKFAEQLRNSGKQVEILAYQHDTKTNHKADVQVFNKKGVNWYAAPVDERALRFAEKKFDLLFACFITENLPLEFISAISKARWRVGIYNKAKTNCYDMMINSGDKANVQYFITQATEFLKNIKYDTN